MTDINSNSVEITLPGLPRGKGRPRFSSRGGRVRTYTDEKTASFEGALRMAGAVAMGDREPLACALAADVTAVFPIPDSWSKTKRDAALAGAVRPTGKPDVDNIAKAALDGLNGIAYRDDAQIVRATVTKRYGTNPETVIVIRDYTA